MNSTRRFAGRIGSALALFLALAFGWARADSATYLFQNQSLTFTHLARVSAGTAVGVNDPALRALLKSLGATLTWHPGERYVLIATPQPLVLNFGVGQRRFDTGLLSANAAFAPYLANNEVFLPFDDLMRGLSLAVRPDGNANVLQPELTSVDIQGSGAQAIVVAHAALPLHPRVLADAGSSIVYAFDGVASSIDGTRDVNAGGIRSLSVSTGGSVRNPRTTIALALAPNTRHDVPRSSNGDFEVGFGANGGAPPLVAAAVAPSTTSAPAVAESAVPLSEPTVQPSAPVPQPTDGGSATVTGVSVAGNAVSVAVNVPANGSTTYEWHRLREPDNRFWIDIKGAQLQGGPRDEAEPDPLISLRVRQVDPQTVRVALSFSSSRAVAVSPGANGIVITYGDAEVANGPRTGSGTIGTVVAANEPQTLVTPVPPEDYGQNPPAEGSDSWKYGPRSTYVPTNPRLIVIDPGHGGGDRGAIRNGTSEAELTLAMSKRLRDILIARGWQVRMTHADDSDVHATPASSAEAEAMGYTSQDSKDLQARDDIANEAGARLFISIHVNSFINSGPSGTTTYYAKPGDLALAQIVSRTLAANLGTKNDGVIKSKFYIPLHARMPAVLIETAFLSNPYDYEKLITDDFQQKVANDIADGIEQYTRQYPVQTVGAQ